MRAATLQVLLVTRRAVVHMSPCGGVQGAGIEGADMDASCCNLPAQQRPQTSTPWEGATLQITILYAHDGLPIQDATAAAAGTLMHTLHRPGLWTGQCTAPAARCSSSRENLRHTTPETLQQIGFTITARAEALTNEAPTTDFRGRLRATRERAE